MHNRSTVLSRDSRYGFMHHHATERSFLCIGYHPQTNFLSLKVLVTTIDAQSEGMGDVGSARYEPALLSPCPTIRVLRYSN